MVSPLSPGPMTVAGDTHSIEDLDDGTKVNELKWTPSLDSQWTFLSDEQVVVSELGRSLLKL